MAFPQVTAIFLVLFDAIGIPGNLLVITTIVLEKRFHVMWNILLASLALSDILLLILFNSFRIASIAYERWLYGKTMCYLNPCFGRYFYLNTVLHLVAVSYERYHAVVKSPLTYDGTITKGRLAFVGLIWIIPIPLSIAPLLGFGGEYVYNSELFHCEQGWSLKSSSISGTETMFFAITFLVTPFLVLAFLNWSVYKTAKTKINALEVQVGSLDGSAESQMSSRKRDRKVAIDVTIIIAAFILCFLPSWICGFVRKFAKQIEVPAEAVMITNCVFMVSSLCNPIIYSIRKRHFRAGVRNLFRQFRCNNNVITVNNLTDSAPTSTQKP